MMAFICVLYFEQKSGNLNPTMKLVVVGSFVILVIINILLEVAMLVKELASSCCKKKDQKPKLNQVAPLGDGNAMKYGMKQEFDSEFPLEVARNRIEMVEGDRTLSRVKRKEITGARLRAERISPVRRKKWIHELRENIRKSFENQFKKDSKTKEQEINKIKVTKP